MIKWETIKVLLDRNKNEIKRFLFKTYTNDNYGYPLDETEYEIAPGECFEDVIFLDLERINPKEFYLLSPRLVYSLKN